MAETGSSTSENGLRFHLKDQTSLWEHMVKKSHVRLGTKADFVDRKSHIARIAAEVNEGSFSPRNLGFLSAPKSNGVPRFIPVLDIDTTCVFYACIRAIDERCADFAVPGTYGGWSLGGKRRKAEEEEVLKWIVGDGNKVPGSDSPPTTATGEGEFEKATESEEVDLDLIVSDEVDEIDDGSAPSSPYNKAAWVENWQEYWKVTALIEEGSGGQDVFLNFDIANFYDSIDQVRLRRRVQDKCSDQMHALDVLEYLLAQWNKALRFYQPSSKGLPMDMVGDMSRVLANFYMVEFDLVLRERVIQSGGVYVRWADDMTIRCKDELEAHKLLYFAGDALHNIGLNLNTAKVKIRNKSEYSSAWGFDIMDALQDEGHIAEGVAKLRDRWDDPQYERKETALKRAITLLGRLPEFAEERKWAFQVANETDGLRSRITNGQMWSLIECAEDKAGYANSMTQEILSGLFTDPKAHLLRCLERRSKDGVDFQKLFEDARAFMLASEHPIMKLAAIHAPY